MRFGHVAVAALQLSCGSNADQIETQPRTFRGNTKHIADASNQTATASTEPSSLTEVHRKQKKKSKHGRHKHKHHHKHHKSHKDLTHEDLANKTHEADSHPQLVVILPAAPEVDHQPDPPEDHSGSEHHRHGRHSLRKQNETNHHHEDGGKFSKAHVPRDADMAVEHHEYVETFHEVPHHEYDTFVVDDAPSVELSSPPAPPLPQITFPIPEETVPQATVSLMLQMPQAPRQDEDEFMNDLEFRNEVQNDSHIGNYQHGGSNHGAHGKQKKKQRNFLSQPPDSITWDTEDVVNTLHYIPQKKKSWSEWLKAPFTSEKEMPRPLNRPHRLQERHTVTLLKSSPVAKGKGAKSAAKHGHAKHRHKAKSIIEILEQSTGSGSLDGSWTEYQGAVQGANGQFVEHAPSYPTTNYIYPHADVDAVVDATNGSGEDTFTDYQIPVKGARGAANSVSPIAKAFGWVLAAVGVGAGATVAAVKLGTAGDTTFSCEGCSCENCGKKMKEHLTGNSEADDTQSHAKAVQIHCNDHCTGEIPTTRRRMLLRQVNSAMFRYQLSSTKVDCSWCTADPELCAELCEFWQCRLDAISSTGAVGFEDQFKAVSRFCLWEGVATGSVDLGDEGSQAIEFESKNSCHLTDCMVWCTEMNTSTHDLCHSHCKCMDCVMPAFYMTTVAHDHQAIAADDTGASTGFTNAMSICYDHPRYCPADKFSTEYLCNLLPGSTESLCKKKSQKVTKVKQSCQDCIVDAFNVPYADYKDFSLFISMSGHQDLGNCLNYHYLMDGAEGQAAARCSTTDICPVWSLASDAAAVNHTSLGHVEHSTDTTLNCPLIGCRQACAAARSKIHEQHPNVTAIDGDIKCEEICDRMDADPCMTCYQYYKNAFPVDEYGMGPLVTHRMLISTDGLHADDNGLAADTPLYCINPPLSCGLESCQNYCAGRRGQYKASCLRSCEVAHEQASQEECIRCAQNTVAVFDEVGSAKDPVEDKLWASVKDACFTTDAVCASHEHCVVACHRFFDLEVCRTKCTAIFGDATTTTTPAAEEVEPTAAGIEVIRPKHAGAADPSSPKTVTAPPSWEQKIVESIIAHQKEKSQNGTSPSARIPSAFKSSNGAYLYAGTPNVTFSSASNDGIGLDHCNSSLRMGDGSSHSAADFCAGDSGTPATNVFVDKDSFVSVEFHLPAVQGHYKLCLVCNEDLAKVVPVEIAGAEGSLVHTFPIYATQLIFDDNPDDDARFYVAQEGVTREGDEVKILRDDDFQGCDSDTNLPQCDKHGTVCKTGLENGEVNFGGLPVKDGKYRICYRQANQNRFFRVPIVYGTDSALTLTVADTPSPPSHFSTPDLLYAGKRAVFTSLNDGSNLDADDIKVTIVLDSESCNSDDALFGNVTVTGDVTSQTVTAVFPSLHQKPDSYRLCLVGDFETAIMPVQVRSGAHAYQFSTHVLSMPIPNRTFYAGDPLTLPMGDHNDASLALIRIPHPLACEAADKDDLTLAELVNGGANFTRLPGAGKYMICGKLPGDDDYKRVSMFKEDGTQIHEIEIFAKPVERVTHANNRIEQTVTTIAEPIRTTDSMRLEVPAAPAGPADAVESRLHVVRQLHFESNVGMDVGGHSSEHGTGHVSVNHKNVDHGSADRAFVENSYAESRVHLVKHKKSHKAATRLETDGGSAQKMLIHHGAKGAFKAAGLAVGDSVSLIQKNDPLGCDGDVVLCGGAPCTAVVDKHHWLFFGALPKISGIYQACYLHVGDRAMRPVNFAEIDPIEGSSISPSIKV